MVELAYYYCFILLERELNVNTQAEVYREVDLWYAGS